MVPGVFSKKKGEILWDPGNYTELASGGVGRLVLIAAGGGFLTKFRCISIRGNECACPLTPKGEK